MAAPFGKLLYLYVGTSDFDRDLKYYTDVLGASVLWNHHAFGAKVAALRLCDGPQYLLADHRSAPSCLPLFEVQDLKAKARSFDPEDGNPQVVRSKCPPDRACSSRIRAATNSPCWRMCDRT